MTLAATKASKSVNELALQQQAEERLLDTLRNYASDDAPDDAKAYYYARENGISEQRLVQLRERVEQEATTNFQQLNATGRLEAWVSQRVEGWDHSAWTSLLADLKQTGFWPIHFGRLRTTLEELRKTKMEARNKAQAELLRGRNIEVAGVHATAKKPHETAARGQRRGHGSNTGAEKKRHQWNELRCFVGHIKRVECVCITPDGKELLSASSDGTVRFWNCETGKEVVRFNRHSGKHICVVNSVAFVPRGYLAASGGEDCCLRLWDLGTGREKHRFEVNAIINSVASSPVGLLVAAGCDDGTLHVWSTATAKEVHWVRGHAYGAKLSDVAFSPNGNLVATAGTDGSLKLWDVTTGKTLKWSSGRGAPRDSLGDGHGPTRIAFSRSSELIASLGAGKVRLWSVEQGLELASTSMSEGTCITFLRGDNRLFCGSNSGGVHVISCESRGGTYALEECWSFHGHNGDVSSVSAACDNQCVVSGGGDNVLKLWQTTEESRDILSLLPGG